MIDFANKKFGLISLGCDKNRVDAEKLLAIIQKAGGKLTNDPSSAQVLIVNTCAFLNDARAEAIETILDFGEYKNQGLEKLVVTGCLPEKYVADVYDGLPEVDLFLGIADYDNFLTLLDDCYKKSERVNGVHSCQAPLMRTERVITTPYHYAYLKIADGCNNHCTYCLIPKIRGKYKSYSIESLVEEAKNLGDVKELILVAQDVTRYGIDLYGQKNLVKLLQNLTKLVNISSVRLLYCYPDAIDDELIAEIKSNDKIIKYLDIPLQHSEDRILKLMNRRGSRQEYLDLFNKLRREIPQIAIRSTFITGFPSETEEEHLANCKFLEEAKLVNCGFFAYSKEEDTPSYKLKGHLPKRIKEKRVKKLYSVQSAISREYLSSYVGKTIDVLCDGIDYEKECFVGRAYFNAPDIDGKVYFNSPFAEQGETVKVLILSCDDYDLYGKTEDYDVE